MLATEQSDNLFWRSFGNHMKRAALSVASLSCVGLILLALFRNSGPDVTLQENYIAEIGQPVSSIDDIPLQKGNSGVEFEKQMIPRGKDTKLQVIPPSWSSNSSFLEAVPKVGNFVPALDGFVPHLDKVHVPDTWAGIRKMFGAHLDFALLIVLLALSTWAYVRYIRPKLKKSEEDGFVLDENDTTASLLLLPDEQLLFRGEEPATQSW